MPLDKKPDVDITNRPSDREKHTVSEWREHFSIREDRETRHDIRQARLALGKVTVRAFAETFCYDDPEVRDYILSQIDPDQTIGELQVDQRAMRSLADRVGGKKAAHVVAHSELREITGDEPETKKSDSANQDIGDQQVELLRALLKTMDPEVVKRALTGK